MPSSKPKYLRSKPRGSHRYQSVEVRSGMKVPSKRAIENLSNLSTLADGRHGVDPLAIQNLLMQIASGEPIRARLEPKKTPGKYRELWVPQDETYKKLLRKIGKVLSSMATSAEAIAFRPRLSAYRGFRGALDDYEEGCDEKEKPKKINAQSEGHVIHTAYQGDIKNYYGSITHEQVQEFLRLKLMMMLRNVLPDEEIQELADLITDIACPGEVLPQGFSTSPAIANGVGVPIDLAVRHGVRDILGPDAVSEVIRYADDICILTSEEYNRRIMGMVASVLDRQGLKLHPKKTSVTRDFRFDFLGARIPNDGDGPLRFEVHPDYVRQIEKAMRYCLENPDEVTPKEVRRVAGGVTHIKHVLMWGTPHMKTLRRQQKDLLPRRLDVGGLWKEFFETFDTKGYFTIKDPTTGDPVPFIKEDTMRVPDKNLKEGRITTTDVPREEVLTDAIPFDCSIEKLEEGVVQINDFRLDKAHLEGIGFPTDPSAVDDFLYEHVESALESKIEELREMIIDRKVNKDPEAILAPENADIWGLLQEMFLEFAKWHLVVTNNVPGFNDPGFAELTGEIGHDIVRDGTSVVGSRVPVFPGMIGEHFGGFVKMLRQVLAATFDLGKLQEAFMLKPKVIQKKASDRFVRPRTTRDAKGRLLTLPNIGEGGIVTASGRLTRETREIYGIE
jgi:hypothetical protein